MSFDILSLSHFQALKDIIAGKSINSSSQRYAIPARTLRDWMKRLNIKSVFTHHSQKDGSTTSSSNAAGSTPEVTVKLEGEAESSDFTAAMPGILSKLKQQQQHAAARGKENSVPAAAGLNRSETEEEIDDDEDGREDKEEDEIDDDEEQVLKIDEQS